MPIGASDPKRFQGMMDAFAMAAPAAAVEIVLPAFTFGPSCTQIARIAYMNQCNPGQIMMVGAYWFQPAEKYITGGEDLEGEVSAMDAEAWEGEDCDAFVDQSGKASMQLYTIAAVAVRTAAMTIAATGLGILKSLDAALEALGNGLAAFIGGQGAYNLGLNANDLAGNGDVDGKEDPRATYGVDPGNLDFLPFVDTPEGQEEPAGTWEKPTWADDPTAAWGGR